MMKQYAPRLTGLRCYSGAGSTGDGIRMGIKAGAQLLNMDSVIVGSTGSLKRSTRIAGLVETFTEGGILVNKKTIRFTDETKGPYRMSMPLMKQPDGVALLVFDENILNRISLKYAMPAYLAKGLFQYGDNARDLAERTRMDVTAFEKTVNPRFPHGKLYGTWVQPCVTMTHGGLKIDDRAQVIHQSGYVIPHLYSAGDNTPGLGGSSTPYSTCPGYMTGCGYLWALASGRIAGQNAAQEL